MPCTPEEVQELSELIAQGKHGETTQLSIDLPAPTQNPAVVETNRKMGLVAPLRTQRAAMGDYMAVNAVDPLTRINIQKENFVAKEFKNYREAVAPLMKKDATWWNRVTRTMSGDTDQKLREALEKVDKGGKYIGAPGAFEPEVLDAAIKVRGIYDRLFEEFKIDPDKYLRGYNPMVRQRPGGIFWKDSEHPYEIAFKKNLSPEEIIFYHELERKGLILNPDPTASGSFISYINGLANAKILRPEVERLEKDVVNPFYGFKIYESPDGVKIPVANDAVAYAHWKETIHHMFGGPTPLDRSLTNSMQSLARMAGYDADTRSLYQMSQGLQNLVYSGAMG